MIADLVAARIAHEQRLARFAELPQPHNWDVSGSVAYSMDCIRHLEQIIAERDKAAVA